MNQNLLSTLVQLITLISVIFGLGLVVWELRQGRDLVRAELTADAIAQLNAQNIAVMGETVAIALARACDEPAELSTHDMIALDGYYRVVLDRLRRLQMIERRVDVDIAGDRWELFAGPNFRTIFETRYGRWWWNQFKPVEPEIIEFGDAYLQSLGEPTCKTSFDGYRDSLIQSEEVESDRSEREQKARTEIREAVFGIKADIESASIQGLQDIHLFSEKFSKFGPRSFERQDVVSTNESEADFFSSIADASYEINELKIDVFGDVGIATYYPEVSFIRDSERIQSRGRQTLVFLRTDTGWKLVHEHGTGRQ